MKRIIIIARVRQGPTDFRDAWESLGFREKLRLANFWILFNIIGNLSQFFSGVITVLDNGTLLKVHEALIGLGTFCAWVGLVQYLDHTSKTYTIINTIKRSSSVLGPYLIGILPIFMAYCFLGICLFWKTGIYTGTTSSMVAAFALINGDSVYAFFSASYEVNSFLGQLYMYTFIVFFICCVHNIFIGIIQEGFGSLSERPPKPDGVSDEETDMIQFDEPPGSPGSGQRTLKRRVTVKEIEQKEKAKKSKDVFKRIISGEMKAPLLVSQEDSTQTRIERMNRYTDEIENLLRKLQKTAFPRSQEEVNEEEIRAHLEKIINDKLSPKDVIE